jgi:hypothetical protein
VRSSKHMALTMEIYADMMDRCARQRAAMVTMRSVMRECLAGADTMMKNAEAT